MEKIYVSHDVHSTREGVSVQNDDNLKRKATLIDFTNTSPCANTARNRSAKRSGHA